MSVGDPLWEILHRIAKEGDEKIKRLDDAAEEIKNLSREAQETLGIVNRAEAGLRRFGHRINQMIIVIMVVLVILASLFAFLNYTALNIVNLGERVVDQGELIVNTTTPVVNSTARILDSGASIIDFIVQISTQICANITSLNIINRILVFLSRMLMILFGGI